MAFPEAQLLNFDDEQITPIEYDDVEHVSNDINPADKCLSRDSCRSAIVVAERDGDRVETAR